jgi:hypothetical protein
MQKYTYKHAHEYVYLYVYLQLVVYASEFGKLSEQLRRSTMCGAHAARTCVQVLLCLRVCMYVCMYDRACGARTCVQLLLCLHFRIVRIYVYMYICMYV